MVSLRNVSFWQTEDSLPLPSFSQTWTLKPFHLVWGCFNAFVEKKKTTSPAVCCHGNHPTPCLTPSSSITLKMFSWPTFLLLESIQLILQNRLGGWKQNFTSRILQNPAESGAPSLVWIIGQTNCPLNVCVREQQMSSCQLWHRSCAFNSLLV